MVATERGDVEILVRAGAPSRPLDDSRHRAFVEAYLSFEPAKRYKLDIEDELQARLDEQVDSQLQEELAQSTQEERESAESWKPDEEEYGTSGSKASQGPASMSFMDSPDMSFRSVLHNNDSPVFRGQTIRDEHVLFKGGRTSQDSTGSWELLRSVISDSQPEPAGQLPAFVSPTKVLEDYCNRTIAQTNQSRSPREGDRVTGVEMPNAKSQSPLFSLSISAIIASSSPADFPSSPSPIKSSQRRSARILKRIENLSSSQALVKGSKTKKEEVAADKTPTSQDLVKGSRRRFARMEKEDMAESLHGSVTGSKRKVTEFTGEEITKSSEDLAAGLGMNSVDNLVDNQISSSLSIQLPRSTSFPLSLPSAKPKAQYQTERPFSQPEPRATLPSTNIATSSIGSTSSPWSTTLEINSNPPATSNQTLTPEMLATPPLQRLVTKMSQDNPFIPSFQTRELRPFERGNWLVDCSTWNDGLKARAWDMLGNFVGKDMAGWGVRCVRDEDHRVIRVFCWGAVVEHTWFLLFLASEGKIKHGEAHWVGGDGVTIVQMR